jgi:hypothetical protein
MLFHSKRCVRSLLAARVQLFLLSCAREGCMDGMRQLGLNLYGVCVGLERH